MQYFSWFRELFSKTKSFRDNPIIGSRTLNKMGLHVARILLSHSIMHFRWLLIRTWASKEDRKNFHRDGFLMKQNFLPEETFIALNQEVRQAQEQVRECIQGDTLTLRIFLDDETLERHPVTKSVVQPDSFLDLLRYCSATLSRPFMYVQSIKNHFIEGQEDPQKTLHSDTFHPTVKAWLFLDDVTEENGPFTYAPGSHKLSWKRLKWEYKQSLVAAENPNHYCAKGSLRAYPKDIEAMGLQTPKAFTVPANTFVIANTHGFHCRGQALKKSSRLELWFYSRTNPFIPLPNVDHEIKRTIEQGIVRERFKKMDELKGDHATWHLVDSDKIHLQP